MSDEHRPLAASGGAGPSDRAGYKGQANRSPFARLSVRLTLGVAGLFAVLSIAVAASSAALLTSYRALQHCMELTRAEREAAAIGVAAREQFIHVEMVANVEGDWAFHCHKSHHTMNAMGHDVPNMLGVKQGPAIEDRVRSILPGYMAMGEGGMGNMMDMGRPKNTLPMMTGEGPYGPVEMGGMFTILKVRSGLKSYDDPGWYKNPPRTSPWKVTDAATTTIKALSTQ